MTDQTADSVTPLPLPPSDRYVPPPQCICHNLSTESDPDCEVCNRHAKAARQLRDENERLRAKVANLQSTRGVQRPVTVGDILRAAGVKPEPWVPPMRGNRVPPRKRKPKHGEADRG